MVDAGIEIFSHDITDIFHHIGVVTCPTQHDVGTSTAIQIVVTCTADQGVIAVQARQDVVTAIADDDVIQRIARTVNVGRSGQREVLYIVGQRVADRRERLVRTSTQVFHNKVADIVDDVGVITKATRHHVRTRTAIKQVISAIGN